MDADHFFLTSNVLSASNLVPAGAYFSVTVTPQSGSPVSYTVPTDAFTTEAITITGMSTAGGPIPSTEATDPNLANFPFNAPITVNWTLPKTFPIVQVKLDAQLFTGDQTSSNSTVYNCNLNNDGNVLPITATLDTITIPDTCNSLPVKQVNLNLEVVGVNGERELVIYFFDGMPAQRRRERGHGKCYSAHAHGYGRKRQYDSVHS